MPHPAAQFVERLLVFTVQPAQPANFSIYARFLDDDGIARCDGLHLGVSERSAIHVFNPPQVALTAHHLSDEFGLCLQALPHEGVK